MSYIQNLKAQLASLRARMPPHNLYPFISHFAFDPNEERKDELMALLKQPEKLGSLDGAIAAAKELKELEAKNDLEIVEDALRHYATSRLGVMPMEQLDENGRLVAWLVLDLFEEDFLITDPIKAAKELESLDPESTDAQDRRKALERCLKAKSAFEDPNLSDGARMMLQGRTYVRGGGRSELTMKGPNGATVGASLWYVTYNHLGEALYQALIKLHKGEIRESDTKLDLKLPYRAREGALRQYLALDKFLQAMVSGGHVVPQNRRGYGRINYQGLCMRPEESGDALGIGKSVKHVPDQMLIWIEPTYADKDVDWEKGEVKIDPAEPPMVLILEPGFHEKVEFIWGMMEEQIRLKYSLFYVMPQRGQKVELAETSEEVQVVLPGRLRGAAPRSKKAEEPKPSAETASASAGGSVKEPQPKKRRGKKDAESEAAAEGGAPEAAAGQTDDTEGGAPTTSA